MDSKSQAGDFEGTNALWVLYSPPSAHRKRAKVVGYSLQFRWHISRVFQFSFD